MSTNPTVAVLGTGSAGMRHIRMLQQAKCPVYAIPAERGEERRATLERADVPIPTAKNIQEAFTELKCSHLIIATNSGRHHLDVSSGLEVGYRNILVEKPLATNMKQAKQIILDLKHLKHLKHHKYPNVFVAAPLRFSSIPIEIHNLINDVGRIVSFHIKTFSYLPEWRPDRDHTKIYSAKDGEGGVLLDLIHDIDLACLMLQGAPAQLQAIVQNQGILGVMAPETAHILWQRPAGATVNLTLSYFRPIERDIVQQRTYEIYGSRASKSYYTNIDTLHLNDLFRRQDEAFIQNTSSIRYNLATVTDGIRAIAIVEAAMKASQLRREVKVEYPL